MTDRRVLLALVAALVAGTIGVGAVALARSSPRRAAVAGTSTSTTTSPAPPPSATTATSPPNQCTTPNFTTSSKGGGTAYGSYYVTNNMWNPISVRQTLHACAYGSWYVESAMTSQGGAVQTYPNAQMTFDNRPELRTLRALVSSFAESTTPSGSGYDYEYAYDIWINGYGGAGHSELMIWNYDNGQTTGGAQEGTFTEGGHKYDVFLRGTPSSGDTIYFVSTSNFTSGTLDLVDFFRQAMSRGWVDGGSSAKLWQVDYGVEICSTDGRPAKFDFTNFDVLPAYSPGVG